MRGFSCLFHVAPLAGGHPGDVNPRRLAFPALVLFCALAVGSTMPRVLRSHEPTVVRPIILGLEDRGSEVRTDSSKEKQKQSAHGGAANGEGSNGARPVLPPPPPPAGEDDGSDYDGDDDGADGDGDD
jgi:hypothetical protein